MIDITVTLVCICDEPGCDKRAETTRNFSSEQLVTLTPETFAKGVEADLAVQGIFIEEGEELTVRCDVHRRSP